MRKIIPIQPFDSYQEECFLSVFSVFIEEFSIISIIFGFKSNIPSLRTLYYCTKIPFLISEFFVLSIPKELSFNIFLPISSITKGLLILGYKYFAILLTI